MKTSLYAAIGLVLLISSAASAASPRDERLYRAAFSAAETAQPPEDSSRSGFFSADWLGTGHKIIGYSALATGLAAAGTGIMLERDYSANRRPSGAVKGMHSFTAAASGTLCVGAALSGLAAYRDVIDCTSVNTYSVHMGLGMLSTLGFLTSIAIAPEAEGNAKLRKSSYSAHCGLGMASGVTMFATVIVIQF